MECVVDGDCKDCDKAFDMAIKALKQEPCEDAISRQAAKRIIFDEFEGWPSDEEVAQMKMLTKQLDELPPVTPKQRTGHWILDDRDNGITCDQCGCGIYAIDIMDGDPHYCPNCGARMESEATSGESYEGEFEAMEHNGRMDAVESDHD